MPTSTRLHAEFAREEARERHFELRIGEEEDALAGELEAMARHGLARALDAGRGDGAEALVGDAPVACRGLQPERRAFDAEREGRAQPLRAAALERARRVGEEGLRQQEARVRADRGQVARAGAAAGSRPGRCRARRTVRRELVLDHVGQRAHDQQLPAARRPRSRHLRHQRGEAGVLALGEGGLDAAAGVVQHAHRAAMNVCDSRCGRARQVELDDLGRAGADEEQHA